MKRQLSCRIYIHIIFPILLFPLRRLTFSSHEESEIGVQRVSSPSGLPSFGRSLDWTGLIRYVAYTTAGSLAVSLYLEYQALLVNGKDSYLTVKDRQSALVPMSSGMGRWQVRSLCLVQG